jgi:DNA excision repair protein ERCC-2
VICFGVPFINTESLSLKARLEFNRTVFNIKETEFLSFDALRAASQCMGRVLRSKNDYGIMIFAGIYYFFPKSTVFFLILIR